MIKTFKTSLARQALLGMIVILLPILIAFTVCHYQNRKHAIESTFNNLTNLAEAYEGQIYLYIDCLKQNTKAFASDGLIKTSLYNLTHGYAGTAKQPDNGIDESHVSPPDEDNHIAAALSKHLIENKLPLNADIKIIHVLDSNGCVIASTNTIETGMDYSQETFFIKGKEATTTNDIYAGHGTPPELAISTPVLHGGKPVGVIVNFVTITKINEILSGEYLQKHGLPTRQETEIWKSMDVYLVNSNRHMITASRFVKNALLKQSVDTLPVETALTFHKEMTGFYKDYRGIETLGASMFIPSLEWVLLAEVDRNEALAHVNKLFFNVVIMGAVVVAMLTMLFILFIKKMLPPFRAISHAARNIALGNFDIVIPVTMRNEIGTLCEALNRMARDIKTKTIAQSQLTALLNATPDFVGSADLNGKITYLNPAARMMLGIGEDEDLSAICFTETHPECANKLVLEKGIPAVINKGIWYGETALLAWDGREIPVSQVIIAHKDSDGTVKFLSTIARNITARKRLENELQKTRDHLEQAQKIARVGSGEWDLENGTTCWSDELYRILGIDPGTKPVTLDAFLLAVHPDDREFVRSSVYDAIYEKKPFNVDHRLVLSNGAGCIVHSEARVIYDKAGKPARMYGIVQDITRQKRAEDALRESEAKMTSVLENTTAIIYIKDRQGRFLFVNKQFERQFGINRERMLGKTPHELFPPELADEYLKNDLKAFEAKTPMEFDETVAHDDRIHSYISIKFPLFDAAGNAYAVCGISTDITERKRTEDALRKSENKYKILLENLPQRIFYKDRNSVYISCNENYARYLNIKPDEIAGKTDYDFFPAERVDKYRMSDQRVMESGKTKEMEERYVENGQEVIVRKITIPVRDEENNITGVLSIFWDITADKLAERERQDLREQLYHLLKMESIGSLAEGIAHDFNNILAIITSYGGLLESEFGENQAIKEYAKNILEAAGSAARLTHGLLAFSRKQEPGAKPVCLKELIRKVHDIVSGVIGEDITAETTFTKQDCVVMANSSQLEQVLMNLITNARDAMPHGGMLAIRTDAVVLEKTRQTKFGRCEAGKYAVISVSDTGEGMDKLTMERIFEPYFTTKGIGKGSGIGLSVVYGIIKQHKGYVDFVSRQGKGTVFKIYLPLAESMPEETSVDNNHENISFPPYGSETILIAEDDKTVRDVARRIFEEYGYTVLMASDGNDAIDKFVKNQEKVQLLIFDVRMPRKNGKEAYEAIKKIKPDIKAFFISGNSMDILEENEGVPVVPKPFLPIELLRKAREALDGITLSVKSEARNSKQILMTK